MQLNLNKRLLGGPVLDKVTKRTKKMLSYTFESSQHCIMIEVNIRLRIPHMHFYTGVFARFYNDFEVLKLCLYNDWNKIKF